MFNKSYFITTAIPYVNSKPHLGHAQEFVLADSIARYYRNQGHRVFLQSGTDDNATKNVLAAQSAGLSTQQFVDLNASQFQKLLSSLNVHPEILVRTSSEKHFQYVQKFLNRLKKEDLYTSTYSGLYCSGCEDFFREKDLVRGRCPDHQTEPEIIEEENTFFRLSAYQETLFQLIESEKIKITPSHKKREILNFIAQGLTDLSLSRSSLRTQGWGVPFPGRDGQIVYVWIDALINYLSGCPEAWSEDTYKVHVIGKNVWKFHAIYWPALLLSASLPLPNEIVIHGFLTNEGVKISKSLGNGRDPFEFIEQYGADALRYYLLGSLSYEQDTDFVEENLVRVYNSDLANKLGNLVSRILALAKGVKLENVSRDIQLNILFKDLRQVAFEKIDALNLEINNLRPWELLKQNEEEKLKDFIESWFYELQELSSILEPLIPDGARRLSQSLTDREGTIPQLYPRKYQTT